LCFMSSLSKGESMCIKLLNSYSSSGSEKKHDKYLSKRDGLH
jgi:hypothetical protein